MAWHDNLLEASFRGITFDVVATDDALDRSLSAHAYPYVDGADVEDLGAGGHTIQVRAIFFGDDYEARLAAFLEVLDQRGAGELVHPVFGTCLAQVRNRSIGHQADAVDAATLSITFIEKEAGKPFFSVRTLATQKAAAIVAPGEAAVAAAGESAVRAVQAARATSPLATLDALRQAMSAPLMAVLAKVNGVAVSGLSQLDYPRAWVSDVGAVVDAVLGLQAFGDTLVADWASLGANIDVIRQKVATGNQPMSSGRVTTDTQGIAATAVYLNVVAATTRGNGAAQLFGAEAETATLSPDEIEAVANAARADLEAAIADARAVYTLEEARAIAEPLKDQALAIQEAARAIIEERPPLIVRTVEVAGNLRLLAHYWYADHTRAPELARLNPALRLPNNLQPGDALNGYAS